MDTVLRDARYAMRMLAKRPAFDQLHADVRLAGLLGGAPELIDGNDGGVIQSRGGTRFLLKTAEALRVVLEIRRQELERDVPMKRQIPRAIHISHPARAEMRQDFVMTDPGTGAECHWRQASHD